jgi:ComF family protein
MSRTLRAPGLPPPRRILMRQVSLRARRHLGRWLDHLAPRACALCGTALAAGALSGVCTGCLLDLPGAARERCPRCALPTAESPCLCTADSCTSDPWPLDAALAVADYAPPFDRLIHALKFGRQLALARPLGELLATAWLGQTDPPALDCLIPVPLGPERLRTRGFNQSLEMARAMSRCMGDRLPVLAHSLARRRDTPEQSRLGLAQRRANLTDAFIVHGRLEGCRVGLVDDVMTSGSTVIAAAQALKDAGAVRVTALLAARTD